ncbi:hypothetical protein LSTR_LSTR010974 [Laodelphax striatellus]|uniref:Uncharacterized protein n=1 Tax=Laodelphax striatellus TaxID=195883 RepID=A0A482XIB7_LAOST|nr:hypothetical protein LSTR_LSTR010974 [Laodelphax striatellus]
MYSQLKSEQSSNGFEKPWSMDLVTRRSKRRSSILGKGRTSLRLSVAGTIPSVVETSPGKIAADKTRVTTGAARKPIADDVLRHFARTNGINPLNPFASQLKESIGSGQSLDENDQEATSCSAPSSSSEGSARKEDPDITGVFFMDDVESVKKRQAAVSASLEVGGKAAPHHLVPCNLMTRSPFTAPKEPLKDQAVRLNREVASRPRGTLTSSSNKRRTMGGAVEKPTRDYSSSRQAVVSPVAPVLSCDSERYLKSASSAFSPVAPVLSCDSERYLKSASLSSSSMSRSMRSEPETVDCAAALRKSLSTTDLANCIATAPGCTNRDARRAASEMHFEEMCKTRCESVEPTFMSDGLRDLFVSNGKSATAALDQTEGRTQERQNSRSTSVRSTLDRMEGHTRDRSSDRPTSVRSSGTKTKDGSTSKSRGRYSVALYANDSSNTVENHTKKSRPSIMSDLIINQKTKYESNEGIFSKNVASKHASETSAKKETEMSNHSKYIDDLLKRIDLSVKANKHTDDQLPDNIDDSSLRNVKVRGGVEERKSKFVDGVVVKNEAGKPSKFLNDDYVLVKDRDCLDESSSKYINTLVENRNGVEETPSNDVCNLKSTNGGENEKEVCNKFNRTLNFDDVDDDNDNTFVYNESVCNNTLLAGDQEQASACKLKKLSVIEEEELRSRMSSTNECEASLMESTIRGGQVGGTDLGGKMAAILNCLQKSQKEFNQRQTEFVEQLKRERNEFVKRQNEQIEAFERFSTAFQQEQTAKLTALCEDVVNLTAENGSCATEEDVFHTAQKKPAESKDSNAIYSSLKSDFKCLKTPNARTNKKAPNLNKTILTPHSMSVCVQEQVSMLFDALD